MDFKDFPRGITRHDGLMPSVDTKAEANHNVIVARPPTPIGPSGHNNGKSD